MATLEQRKNGTFRVVFYVQGRRFVRSLNTDDARSARATQARLEDNLQRVLDGRLPVPEGADLATFLLSDGKSTKQFELKPAITLATLTRDFFTESLVGTLEPSTIRMLQIHTRHLIRHFGESCSVPTIQHADLERYVSARLAMKGRRGGPLHPATVKKEVTTFRSIWQWGLRAGLLKTAFPGGPIRLPKTRELPPFRTFEQIEARVRRGGLSDREAAELWDCLFLTLPEVEECLAYAKINARQPFLYPMLVFAAHTGARRSEMMRATLDDVDLERNTVQIQERKRVRGKHTTREVPLSPTLQSVLRNWLNQHPGGSMLFTLGDESVRYSSKSRSMPEPLTANEATHHLKCTLAGHAKWSKLKGWHVFRHSFCSNCAAKGVDLSRVGWKWKSVWHGLNYPLRRTFP